MNDSFILNDSTINKLLNHDGYGIGINDPLSVELLFIGNESGTGGLSLNEFLNSTHLAQNESKYSEDLIIYNKSPFLQYIKRLSLYFKDEDLKWFQRKNDFKLREDYIKTITNWCGSNVHLIDIRPLPRNNEKEWPYDKFGFDKDDYLKAFDSFNENALFPYGDWVSKRKQKLITQVDSFKNLKYIIAPGAQSLKLDFLMNCFQLQKPFEKVSIKDNKKIFWINEAERNGSRIKICTCPFFNHYILGLNGLRTLAFELLK